MSKKKEKPAPAAEGTDAAPKKRSKLKLAMLVLVPLALAGGGYAGWTFMAGETGEGAAQAAEGEHGQDEMHVAAVPPPVPPEVLAETSYTYSYALSELLREQCGRLKVPALKAASEEEGLTGGPVVNLSWVAAVRRTASLTAKSCGAMRTEIEDADNKAAAVAAEKAAALAKPNGEGGHGGSEHH